MLKLATSIIINDDDEDDDHSLLYKTIKYKNVYTFVYLIRFLDLDQIDIYNLLIYSLDQINFTNSCKIPLIIIDKMFQKGIIYNYIENIVHIIFESKYINIIQYLLNNNIVNPHHIFEDSTTLFERIVELKNEDLVNLMITKFNVDINSKDTEGVPLVIKAIENDCPAISSLFILNKCNLNSCNNLNKSLLELSIEKKWFLHVNYILGNGYIRIYDDMEYFHRLCHLSIDMNSTLIFDKLVTNYFACKIQRYWRYRRLCLCIQTTHIII